MSFIERIQCYCREQLEPGSRLVLSLIVTLFIYLVILLDFKLQKFEWHFLVPAFSTFFLLLYYRISDEFKDFKTDQKFFPDRPIPSGRLKLSDLNVLLIAVTIISVLMNVIFPYAIIEFLLALFFTFCMGKWFFMEKTISSNRLYAFFTHAPVGLFLYWYAEAYLLNQNHLSWSLPEKLSIIGFIVLPGLSWEILRKTYLPEDEMPGYQIYSTMLGFKGSLAFAALWVIITILNNFVMVSLFESLDGMNLPLFILNLLLLVVIFLHGVRPRLKNLKPVAEIYMALHLFIPLATLIYKAWRQLHV
ncbi:hypothetical protein ACJVC5_06875 [Peredibacter sp. HCB2-198]|uniref:hypothetical protein n=1 Tax=Peredibacter sp. HCB2-198 TaxID=3383025 RepID=UPI0038B4FE5D